MLAHISVDIHVERWVVVETRKVAEQTILTIH